MHSPAAWLLVVVFVGVTATVIALTAGGLFETCRILRAERAARPLRLRVEHRVELSDDAFMISLGRSYPWRQLPRFQPGQHLVLRVPSQGTGTISRAYSLAAWEPRPHCYALGIKRQSEGLVSHWLADNARQGLQLLADPPKGMFHWQQAHGASEVVLIAGGIGITPMRAMLHGWIRSASPPRVVLHFSASTSAQLYFHEEFERLAGARPWFVYHPRITQGTSSAWAGACERLAAADILATIRQPAEARLFICATTAMENAIISGLLAAGIRRDQVSRESFGIAASRNEIEAAISFRGRTFSFAGAPTLLHALAEQGFDIPAECRAGECGRCRLSITRGRARNILTGHEDAHSVLACCAVPASDLELRE